MIHGINMSRTDPVSVPGAGRRGWGRGVGRHKTAADVAALSAARSQTPGGPRHHGDPLVVIG